MSSEEFAQLRLRFIDPIQHNYETIRPIVLFDESVSARSQQTGLERRRIDEIGPAGTFEQKVTVREGIKGR